VRCLDVDPFEPVGIALETGRFLDAFLLYCALEESPKIDAMEGQVHARNFARTVKEGRRPGLTLTRDALEVPLLEWAAELVERIRPIAELLDREHNYGGAHVAALDAQLGKIANPARTPSARVLDEVRALGSFAAFGRRQSEAHAQVFRNEPLMPAETALFDEMARASLDEQRRMEASDTGSFDDFVAAYNSSTLCGAD
jgi:glutamate--cysteine ligase